MDSPLLTLTIGIFFGFFSLIAESQDNVNPSPRPPSPPPAATPPPPPPYAMPPPPPFTSTPPPLPPFTPPPPPPFVLAQPPPPPPTQPTSRSPPSRLDLNTGKKIGMTFIGVVVMLQVCVAAFLLITKRQLLKGVNLY